MTSGENENTSFFKTPMVKTDKTYWNIWREDVTEDGATG